LGRVDTKRTNWGGGFFSFAGPKRAHTGVAVSSRNRVKKKKNREERKSDVWGANGGK